MSKEERNNSVRSKDHERDKIEIAADERLGRLATRILDKRPAHKRVMDTFKGWPYGEGADPTLITVQHSQMDDRSISSGYATVQMVRWANSMAAKGELMFPVGVLDRDNARLARIIAKFRELAKTIEKGTENIDTSRIAILDNLRSVLPEDIAADLELTDRSKGIELFGKLSTASDETVGDFIIWHGEYLERKNRELEPVIDTLKQEFTDAITAAIDSHNLPVSHEQLKTRMDNISFTVCDPIAMNMESLGGYYNVHTRDIYVAPYTKPENLKKVVFHELMHHLSGQTTYIDRDLEEDWVSGGRGIRSGLVFPSGDRVPTWMNEAITEQMAQVLLGDQDIDFEDATVSDFFAIKEGTYLMERDAMSVVMEDISLKDMLRAYFEDAVPSDDAEAILPAARQFWGSVTDELGDAFLKHAMEYSTFGDDPRKFRNFISRFGMATKRKMPGRFPAEDMYWDSRYLRVIFGYDT